VLPGPYQVRLTIDGKSFAAPLAVKMDPRVKTPMSGLQRKEEAEMRLASVMTQTTQAILQANSIRSQLEKLTNSKDTTKNAVEEFKKKLTALVGEPGGFFTPPSTEATLSRANGEVSTLYQQIWQVDAEPTSTQTTALDSAERSGTDVLKRWADLKNTSLPELNRVLRDSQAPEIRVEDHPPQIENSVDEE
jgi:hypothetical protein